VKRFDVLPDDVLLEIFDFCMRVYPSYGVKLEVESWQSLVHVCRRWRNVIFGSPLRLNLQLHCTPATPARNTLDVWPALPLIVKGSITLSGTDNVITVLEQSNRVCQVNLTLTGRQLEKVLAPMQVPFPELTSLRLISDGETLPVIPDLFLDGSAPRLRFFTLDGIPFPGLPKLLLSANHLVDLWLTNIPHSGYISPEAMIALLSVLFSLRTLSLKFQSPQSLPERKTRRPPPPKRSVIPTLDLFIFKGVIEYLEDLVTFIDTPKLKNFHITFFNQIDFDTPRLAQFISRTPKLRKRDADVQFNDNFARVGLPPGTLEIAISCRVPDWQLSSVAQVCNSSLHPLSTVEDLYIEHRYSQLVWKGDAIENTLWLELLLPFTAVKNLYLSKVFAQGIAAALQELVGDRITEVLPSLRNIFVKGLERSGPFQKNIGQFAAARQHSGHPFAISVWDKGRM
jgi:F-box-like